MEKNDDYLFLGLTKQDVERTLKSLEEDDARRSARWEEIGQAVTDLLKQQVCADLLKQQVCAGSLLSGSAQPVPNAVIEGPNNRAWVDARN